MKEKFIRFMMGRYGLDTFGYALVICYAILTFLGTFTRKRILIYLSFVVIILFYYRVFSKDFMKRSNENKKFLTYYVPLKNKVRLSFKHLKERKDHKFYKCPNCKQELRVPKGKGLITITCPKCKTKFDKKT